MCCKHRIAEFSVRILIYVCASPSIQSANLPPHQCVTRIFHHPDTMETSIHPSCAKNRLTQNPLRLPAHLSYLSSHSYHGTNCSQSVSISCIHHRPTNSVNRRPLCLPSNRLHYSRTRSTHSHNHAHAHNKSIRHRSMSGF